MNLPTARCTGAMRALRGSTVSSVAWLMHFSFDWEGWLVVKNARGPELKRHSEEGKRRSRGEGLPRHLHQAEEFLPLLRVTF